MPDAAMSQHSDFGMKVAVIGGGHLGRIHAKLLGQMPGVELVGVVDPDPAARRSIGQALGVPTCERVSDLDAGVHAAVVAAPTRLHHAITLDLLARGVHVLVEKPIAASVVEADALIRAARRQRLVLQVGHVERFNPVLDLVPPELAEPRYIEALRCGPFTFRSTDVGAVLDLMIHDIDLALALVRRPVVEVSAIGASVLGGHEDLANARLTFDNGCVAQLSASRVSFETARRMRMFSSRGFASLDFATRKATVVRLSEQVLHGQFNADALPPAEKQEIRERFFETVLPMEQQTARETNAIGDELADFVGAILWGRQPRVTGEQGRAALAVAEQVLMAMAAPKSHRAAA